MAGKSNAELAHEVEVLRDKNDKLVEAVKAARGQIVTLKEEIDRLAQPPNRYGVFLAPAENNQADIISAGQKLRVAVGPTIEPDALQRGREVMLNDASAIVAVCEYERTGEV